MTRKFSLIYKMLTALAILTGLIINLFHTKSPISLLSYYTSQSNIICLVAFICYFILDLIDKNRNYRKNDIYYLIKGAITIMIFLTTFCYHIALSPVGFDMEHLQKDFLSKKISNFILHTCAPWLVILDYFLFDEKGHFKKYYPFLWLFLPLNYLIYVYLYSAQGGTFYNIGGSNQFAYFFLDYKQIGINAVINWIFGICLLVLLFSYLLVYIDRFLFKKKQS